MDVRVTPIDRLLTIHKSSVISIFLHFVHGRNRTARSWDWEWVEMIKWNGSFRSDRSNREKWSTSKGGLILSKLFRLDRTDLFSLRPKFPEILVEWIATNILVLIKTKRRSAYSQAMRSSCDLRNSVKLKNFETAVEFLDKKISYIYKTEKESSIWRLCRQIRKRIRKRKLMETKLG